MPTVKIEYDPSEVRDLIAADIKVRFGITYASDSVVEGPLENYWEAEIDLANIAGRKEHPDGH